MSKGYDVSYPFEILRVRKGVSRSDNQQLIVMCLVDYPHCERGALEIPSYFPKKLGWKLTQLLESIGKADWDNPAGYDGFEIEKLVGCRGKVMLKDDDYEGTVKTVIDKFLKKASGKPVQLAPNPYQAKLGDSDSDDELPF